MIVDVDFFNPQILAHASYRHPALPCDITPCCVCDERHDRPDLCADCRSRYSRIEATEYPDRRRSDAEWFDMVDELLTQLARSARRAS